MADSAQTGSVAQVTSPHAKRTYDVIAIEVPVVFNRFGDHDHNGRIYALAQHKVQLDHIRTHFRLFAQEPHPLVRPLVLRACKGDTVTINFTNHLKGPAGIHLVSDGYRVTSDDGAAVGVNPSSLAKPGGNRKYTWRCEHEGVFPFHDMGHLSGGQDGTNAHGLFGALVVEPAGSRWTDPENGGALSDGLYADVHPPKPVGLQKTPYAPWEKHPNVDPRKVLKAYAEPHESFREFVIFFHDEPEFAPGHHAVEPDPCRLAVNPHHGADAHNDMLPPLMCISYRAEPMINRERVIWQKLREGSLTKQVVNEEQHHSSWMFGDPSTPVLQTYLGDPVRIRLVHAGVKETHVFHLHVYEWHAVPENRNSPLIDAISISPQTGHTIVPLWGAGNLQRVPGDVIWHCHLYPHFHEGMWGIFRTFDTLQAGTDGPLLNEPGYTYPEQQDDGSIVQKHRRIGRYPDGTVITRLEPLPDREPPPRPTPDMPGFPLFIPGTPEQKAPVPPWPYVDKPMPAEYDYRPVATPLERRHFNHRPRPGELFTKFPYPDAVSFFAADETQGHPPPKGVTRVRHDLAVVKNEVLYNDDGWHDPHGHAFVLADEAPPNESGRRWEPLFFRARVDDVLELTLENRLPQRIEGNVFDPPQPRCEVLGVPLAECGLHVHIVKFDPIVADGASTGWNYLSGPRAGKKMIYRWWCDDEFGTIFFHDHLFANYRQKHGLFGALIVEPKGAAFVDPADHSLPAVAGAAAVIKLPDGTAYREFCFGIADFVPLFNRRGQPLNPPATPGGHGDAGVMAVNYRCEPIPERKGDPAFWFSSLRHRYTTKEGGKTVQVAVEHGDPATSIFETYPREPIRLRVVQGSHEESHSFSINGLRWRRFRQDPKSPLRNQQTTGIAEAFTFDVDQPYGPGDYLWRLGAADDLWLGCWGLVRSHKHDVPHLPHLPKPTHGSSLGTVTMPPPNPKRTRRFRIIAEGRSIAYREPDLIDPFGLVYRLEKVAEPGGKWEAIPQPVDGSLEPLVLRCRAGEWISVELVNKLPDGLSPEPFAPTVPVDDQGRMVSRHVSLHADLVQYDIRESDGVTAGRNPVQTAAPGKSITYTWYADQELGPVLLQDMVDFRNHRHHGLVGALIVEAVDATALEAKAGSADERWYGARATIKHSHSGETEEEIVVLLQDGLRLYLNGNTAFPIPDIPADPAELESEHEDQGSKGLNYRSEPVGGPRWLKVKQPATPTWTVPQGARVLLRLITAADKPRGHSFTVHGHTWPAWSHMGTASPRVGSVSSLTTGEVDTLRFIAASEPADYAYRSGVYHWSLSQGMWGILRIAGAIRKGDAPRLRNRH